MGTRSPRVYDRRKFNDILIESIIEGLDFGELILRFLELRTSMKREEIVDKPGVFADELEKLFGSYTADVLEERIIRTLCKKLRIDYNEVSDYTFSRCIRKIYRVYASQSRVHG